MKKCRWCAIEFKRMKLDCVNVERVKVGDQRWRSEILMFEVGVISTDIDCLIPVALSVGAGYQFCSWNPLRIEGVIDFRRLAHAETGRLLSWSMRLILAILSIKGVQRWISEAARVRWVQWTRSVLSAVDQLWSSEAIRMCVECSWLWLKFGEGLYCEE